MTDIVPIGLTPGEVLPGIYLQVDFAQGSQLGAGEARPILCIANKLPSGTAVADVQLYGPDTPVQCVTEAQIVRLAGAGSEAHRMYRRMSEINGGGNAGPKVNWIFTTESAGAKAAASVALNGTATGDATHRLFVGDEMMETPISRGELPADVADAIASNVNGRPHLPVVATSADGAVTLTAKQAGPRGNAIRFQAFIVADHDVGMTSSGAADGALAGGTTADSIALALATIAGSFFYYVVPACDDAVQLAALSSQILTQALPMNGLRQRMIYGSTASPAQAINVAITLNSALGECQHSEKSPWTPAELAASAAMVFSIEEASELRYRSNFISYGKTEAQRALWKVPASRDMLARPSTATVRSLLANGVSPIAAFGNGSTYLVDRFTTRSMNGDAPETRIREAHKVTTMHRLADYISRGIAEAGEGMTLADDPPNGIAPLEGTFTPAQARIVFFEALDVFGANAKIQRVDEIKRSSVVQRERQPGTRLGIKADIQTSDNFRQAAIILAQVA